MMMRTVFFQQTVANQFELNGGVTCLETSWQEYIDFLKKLEWPQSIQIDENTSLTYHSLGDYCKHLTVEPIIPFFLKYWEGTSEADRQRGFLTINGSFPMFERSDT